MNLLYISFAFIILVFPRAFYFLFINEEYDITLWTSSLAENIFIGKDVKVLLVIAHPDDEIMFFTPTLLFMNQSKANFSVLCLSTGNYYSKGLIRRQEFTSLFEEHFPTFNNSIVDNRLLQDSPDILWSKETVSTEIENVKKMFDFNIIITFDEKGVSKHKNHIQTYQGTKLWLRRNEESHNKVKMYNLKTYSLLDAFLWPLFTAQNNVFEIRTKNFNLKALKLMTDSYASQSTWYRYVYLIFSRYSYINIYYHEI